MAGHVTRSSQCTVEHLLDIQGDPLRIMGLFSTGGVHFQADWISLKFSMSPPVELHKRFASCHCILH